MDSLITLQNLSKQEIQHILDVGVDMRKQLDSPCKVSDILKGKSVVTLFYENSTRTRVSFENAGKFLGASVNSVSVAVSSVQKGESLLDTALTIDSMCTDLIVVRHAVSGAPQYIADNVRAKVINAGDGMHEHPTQALLDMLTMYRKFGKLEGLKVAIIGDIKHSRVARSNIWGLSKFGAEVRVFAPSTLLPLGIEAMPCKVCTSMREACEDADVIMGLRIQLERQQKGLFPSVGEYAKFYGITKEVLGYAKPEVIVMHPAPINRNVEITDEVADGSSSVICEQVTNGVAIRMALLKIMLED